MNKNQAIFTEMIAALTRGNITTAKQERHNNVLTIRTDSQATQADIDALIQHHARRTKKTKA